MRRFSFLTIVLAAAIGGPLAADADAGAYAISRRVGGTQVSRSVNAFAAVLGFDQGKGDGWQQGMPPKDLYAKAAAKRTSRPKGDASAEITWPWALGGAYKTVRSTGWSTAGMPGEGEPGELSYDDPFGEGSKPIGSEGLVELGLTTIDYDPNGVTITGTQSHNQDGRFEIAVVRTDGVSDQDLQDVFNVYGSVQKAAASGFIDPQRVLAHWREYEITESEFILHAALPDPAGDYSVISTAHAWSVPEPGTASLLAAALAVMAYQRQGRVRVRTKDR